MALGCENRWERVRQLGSGGQGTVWLVRDKKLYGEQRFRDRFSGSLHNYTSGGARPGDKDEHFAAVRQGILDIVRAESPSHQGALKVLHKPADARDPERASERMRREIDAMSKVEHPNLLRIRDANAQEEWFVSEFHPKGTLHGHLERFKGKLPSALRAFRPLAAAVAELHAKEIVHRDIKPTNVFLSEKDDLVLGDFGLVYFSDDKHSRLSATLENVGSRDWMPQWANGQRLEDVRPTFDVFGLGKLLWALVSGRGFLNLWYFDRDEFNVEKTFPGEPYIEFANRILAKCVVEHEQDCLADAGALLQEIDRALRIIELQGDLISNKVTRTCKVCGIGTYELAVDRNVTSMGNFGVEPRGAHTLKIFTCSHCGHVQLFSFNFNGSDSPPAWSETV